ncbi:MAG: acyltransferase family protein [Eubacterium sp.]|nr:acyltransferase family protein [Eubacterium sp.]
MFSKEDTSKIKGVAIILMIFHHCFMSPSRYKGFLFSFFPLTEFRVNRISLAFKICVALFTFLSSYGIALSYKKLPADYHGKEIRNIILRRYIKLILNFIFVFIFVVLFSVITGKRSFSSRYGTGLLSFLYVVIDMLGLAQLFHTPTFLATFWYISLAILIIFIYPVLYYIYKSYGGTVLLALSVLFSVLFPVGRVKVTEAKSYAYLPMYIVCISLALVCANNNFLVKVKEFTLVKSSILNKGIHFLCLLVPIYVLFHLRKFILGSSLIPIFDAILPLLIICFLFEFIHPIPIIGRVLEFLGTHSMNIFLVHNFVRTVWYKNFTYGFRHFAIIALVLLLVSLGISIVLEFIKKLIHFDEFTQFLIKKVQRI